MRRLLALFAVVAVSAGLISAAAADPIVIKPVVLSSSQLSSLTSPVTRDQQLAMIHKGPLAMQNLLTGISVGTGNHAVSTAQLAAWQAGIVLTPFTSTYGSFNKTNSALCGTEYGACWPACPLPTTASSILWIGGPASAHSLDCVLMPPAGGVYAVTFNMAGGQSAAPHVICSMNHGAFTDVALVGDQSQPQKSTQWTGLITIPDQGKAALAVLAPAVNGIRGWYSTTIRKM